MNYLILFFLLIHIALAQKAEVLILDKNIENSSLEKSFNPKRPQKPFSSLPDKQKRDKLLKDLAWDELKKDIFYMHLKSKNISELSALYPEIDKTRLIELKKQR